MNTMSNWMDIIERERRFIMGSRRSSENRHDPVSQRYQFGYDPRHRPVYRRMEERRSYFSPGHRPGKEPLTETQRVNEGDTLARRNYERTNKASLGRFQAISLRVLTYDEPIVEFPPERDVHSWIRVNSQQQGTGRDQVRIMTNER